MQKLTINNFTDYHKQLKLYLMTILNDDDEINDIMQDVYIKIYLLLNKDKISNTNIKSLLFKIAKNETLSLLRRKKNITTFDDSIIIVDDESYNDVYDNFLLMIEESTDKNVSMIKDQSNGMSIKEMMQKYNLSENAIKSRLFNTKLKLKNKYK